jgi:hypothetical protein
MEPGRKLTLALLPNFDLCTILARHLVFAVLVRMLFSQTEIGLNV